MKHGNAEEMGFTLMELAVAMAVGSVILLAAAWLLGWAGDAYRRFSGGVAAECEARALLSQLAADLGTARFHKDGVMEAAAGVWPGDRIGFLSLQPAVAQSEGGRVGDVCAVYYYVKDLQTGGRTVRCLMRGFRDSAETFDALAAGELASLFVARSEMDEPIAFGVVGFEARPKTRAEDGVWQDWVRNDGAGPAAVEVRLVVARRGLSGNLETADDWDGGGAAGRLLGEPAGAERNDLLEVYGTLMRFGCHAER